MEDVFAVSGPFDFPAKKTAKCAPPTEFVIDGKSPDGKLSSNYPASKSTACPFTTEPPPVARRLASELDGPEPHGSTGDGAPSFMCLLLRCRCCELYKRLRGIVDPSYKREAEYAKVTNSGAELYEL